MDNNINILFDNYELILNNLTTKRSNETYITSIKDFINWLRINKISNLYKSIIQRYKSYLIIKEYSTSTINMRLSVIRKFIREAAENNLIDKSLAYEILNIKNVTTIYTTEFHWLNNIQSQLLIDEPDTTTLRGLRDKAIFSVFLGTALRRSEVSRLEIDHIQQREGRWVIVDLVGKGGNIINIEIPYSTVVAINEWTQTAGITTGRIFRAIHKGGFINGDSMTPQAIYDIVKKYSKIIDVEFTPHDLRRTSANNEFNKHHDLISTKRLLSHKTIVGSLTYLKLH